MDSSEYPRNLKPTSDKNTKLLVETEAAAENISLFIINNKGEKITENREGIIFNDKREDEQHFYIDIDVTNMEGLLRIGARL